MRSGSAPVLSDVAAAVVAVDGVAREATTVSTTRELGGGGVPGGSGSPAASGSVTFAAEDVSSVDPSLSPWTRVGNFPPAPGSAITVDAGVQSQTMRMLSGVVDESSAGSDGIVTSSIIDPVDRLHKTVTFEPMLAIMPPASYGGSTRFVGLSSDYIADQTLRRCGVYSTPNMLASAQGVCVPAQGSMWPDRGTVVASSAFAGAGNARFSSVPWGWAASDVDATYTPSGTANINGLELGVMYSSGHSANASMTLAVGSGTLVLRVLADRSVEVREDNVLRASIAASTSNTMRVSVRFGATSLTLQDSQGRTATGTHSKSGAFTQLRVQAASGARVGGIIAATLPAGWYLGQTLTARLSAGTGMNTQMLASPAIEPRDALDLLTEIAAATCRTFWWDETGTFLWVPGDALLARTPVAELTSLDSLLDLGWSESLGDVSSSVVVASKVPAVTRTSRASVTVWQGGGDSIDEPGTKEEVISPGADEDWVMLDQSPVVAGNSDWEYVNYGRKTIFGATVESAYGTEWGNGYLQTTITRTSVNSWKLAYVSTAPPAGYQLQLTLPNEAATSSLWMRWRNEKLPIVRAYAKTTWTDGSVTAGSGPASAAQYQHDAGPWVQGYVGEGPQTVADFLAAWVCSPRINATNVAVVHDPRVQVGDVVTVRDEHAFGVELRVLVTRVDQSVSPGEQSMSLDFFVISGSGVGVNLRAHDAVMSGSSLTTHDVGEGSGTLAGHDLDPLHRS